MLVFREEKTLDEEVKAWQFWHSRQHSVKQRILDADTKNSSGIVGPIEEVAHNAIAFYWNPLEGQGKVCRPNLVALYHNQLIIMTSFLLGQYCSSMFEHGF